MANFSIGLSGLRVAQQAIETVGTNITNASTDGYHRQEIRVSALPMNSLTGAGGGAEITDISRHIDTLLEMEILRQRPLQMQLEQEISTLRSIEAALGTLDSNSLGASIENFFNAMSELAAQPNSQAHMEQVAWAGESLAAGFRNIANFTTQLKTSITQQAQGTATEINNLLETIAQYNGKIQDIGASGGNTNLLEDRRDEEITKLSELIEIRTHKSGDAGMVNVEAWGIPLVVRTRSTPIETSILSGDIIGVSPQGANYYDSDVSGGSLGGIFNLRNNIIPEIEEKFDTLAKHIIDSVNQIHSQGVSDAGSFDTLTGWQASAEPFDTWTNSVSAGDIYVRVTDTSTGITTRSTVMTLDPSTHTIQDVATALNGIANLTASNNSGQLEIRANSGYTFDFSPAISATPDSSTLTGTASPTFSGVYTGTADNTYTFTVQGSGDVSTSSDLVLQVTDADGVVANLNIGDGYAPGDTIVIEDGISISLTPGSMNNGETFTLTTLASTDAPGVLAALGINAFFKGNDAISMRMTDRIIDNPAMISSSIGPGLDDNQNLQRIANVSNLSSNNLDGLAPDSFFRQLLTGIGQDLAARESRSEGLETVREQLLNQRDYASGVDVNEEAAKLIMYEQMFQAVSKFISTQHQAFKELMTLI